MMEKRMKKLELASQEIPASRKVALFGPANAEVTRAGAENILATVDLPGAGTDVDDYLDESVYRHLRGEGFFDEMERKYGRP